MYTYRPTRKHVRLGNVLTDVATADANVSWWQKLLGPLFEVPQAISNYQTAKGAPAITSFIPGASWVDAITGTPLMTGQPSQAQIQSVIDQGTRDVIAAGGSAADVAQLKQDVMATVNSGGGTRDTLAQLVTDAGSGLISTVDPSTLILWAAIALVGGIVILKAVSK